MFQRPSKTHQAATTTVFWDIDDRPKPDDIQFDDIPAHFSRTLANLMRLQGTVSINAYGDAQRIMGDRKRPNGIKFNQVRSGNRSGRLQKILVDSLFWVIDHPEPSNLVLIVGTISEDSDFVKALSSLRGKDCQVFSQKAEKQGVLLSPNAWTNVNVLGRDGYMADNYYVCSGVHKAARRSSSLASTSSSSPSPSSDSFEEWLKLAYFAKLFEDKRPEDYRKSFWVNETERKACCKYTSVVDPSSISKFWTNLISPPESSSSHEDALKYCLNRAKQFAFDASMKKQLNDIITSSSYMRQKPFFFKGFTLLDYKSSKTIIMWDFENTNVPTYCSPSSLFTNIKISLRNLGYTGDIVMRGYGNVQYLQEHDTLVERGIHITHVDSGKDAGDKRLLNSIHSWAYDNPPPCNMLFITSDGDFATATFRFKTCGYNTMIAHQNRKLTKSKKLTPSKKMIQESSTAWLWPRLAFGKAPYKRAT